MCRFELERERKSEARGKLTVWGSGNWIGSISPANFKKSLLPFVKVAEEHAFEFLLEAIHFTFYCGMARSEGEEVFDGEWVSKRID